jgi:hypothetical protein
VVIVSSRKPKFYTRQRSFRKLDIGHKQVQVCCLSAPAVFARVCFANKVAVLYALHFSGTL